MTITDIATALGGSFLAGAINTLAGNGSVITLTILTQTLGIPANEANATNRVGILLQSMGSIQGFRQHNKYRTPVAQPIIRMTIFGSGFGVLAAILVSPEQFSFVFRYLLLLMLVIILVKPERWIQDSNRTPVPKIVQFPLFFLLGFYGGFIQMGMGIFFLAVLVLLSGYSLMEANHIKTWVIMIYTLLVVLLFAVSGMIDWKAGFLMAGGQTAGGYLTARYAPHIPHINTWAYYLLVGIVLVSVFLQFQWIQL